MNYNAYLFKNTRRPVKVLLVEVETVPNDCVIDPEPVRTGVLSVRCNIRKDNLGGEIVGFVDIDFDVHEAINEIHDDSDASLAEYLS